MDEVVWGESKRDQRSEGQALARSKFSDEAKVRWGGLSQQEGKAWRQPVQITL